MSRFHLVTFVSLMAVSAMGWAKEPISRTSQIAERKPVISNNYLDAIHQRTYDVYVAEPVPEIMYKVEFRYIETPYQEGSDWRVYTITASEDSADDAVLWIALHLIAEWRVTEFEPALQWEHVGSYNSQSTASYIADQWRDNGFHTKIKMSGGIEYDFSELELAF